ncbi:hypothetical protein D3C73_1183780 [compost metagenome]
MTLTFQRQNRKQVVDRIMHVGAVIGGFAVGDPPQTQHRHYMVNTQRPAVLHIGTQQLDKRLVGARGDDMRIHRRQAPVLTERTKNIRRCTNGRFQAVQLTVTPGFRPTFCYADRQIAVQPDRHCKALTGFPTGSKLGIRQPL